MKQIHTRFVFIQDLVFRKLETMSAVKTDVNPSDIGTKALGRERILQIAIDAWYGHRAHLDEFTWVLARWKRVTKTICNQNVR